jgi:hypothetical protein
MNNNIRSKVQNQLVVNTLRVLLIIYTAFVIPLLKQKQVNTVDHPVIRFIVVAVIIYLSFIDLPSAILLALALVLTLQRVSKVSDNKNNSHVKDVSLNSLIKNLNQEAEKEEQELKNKLANKNVLNNANNNQVLNNNGNNNQLVNNNQVPNNNGNNNQVMNNNGNNNQVMNNNGNNNQVMNNNGNNNQVETFDAHNNMANSPSNSNSNLNSNNGMVGENQVTSNLNQVVNNVEGVMSQNMVGSNVSNLAQAANQGTINNSGDILGNNIPAANDNSPVNKLQVFDNANNAAKANNVNVNSGNNNANLERANAEQPASETLTDSIIRAQGAKRNNNEPVGLTSGDNLYAIQENAVPGANIMDEVRSIKEQHSTQNLGKPMGHKARRHDGYHLDDNRHPNMQHAMLRNENL